MRQKGFTPILIILIVLILICGMYYFRMKKNNIIPTLIPTSSSIRTAIFTRTTPFPAYKYYNFSEQEVRSGLNQQLILVGSKSNNDFWKYNDDLEYPYENGNISIKLNGVNVDTGSVDFDILYDSSKDNYFSYIRKYFVDQGYSIESNDGIQYFKSGNIYCVVNDEQDRLYHLSGGVLSTGSLGDHFLISTSCAIINDAIIEQNQLFKKITVTSLNQYYPKQSKYPQRLNIYYIDDNYAYGETWRSIDYEGPGVNIAWLAAKEYGNWKVIQAICGQCGLEDSYCDSLKSTYPNIPIEVYNKACFVY